MTTDELNTIRDRWLRVVGNNLKSWQSDRDALSDYGVLMAFDIPKMLDELAAAPLPLAALELTRGQWIHSVNAKVCLDAIAAAKKEVTND